jgi:hypothetical protein
MAGVVVLLVAVLISIMVTRIATVALTMTGVSHDLARFQARSAFSGVGYTTTEADQMTSHPARRRVVMILMLIGNAGLVTAVASIVSAMVNTGDPGSALLRSTVLVAGLLTLYLFTRSQRVESVMRRIFQRILQRWTSLEIHDYDSLLDLTGAYTVVEIDVGRDDWLAERPLGDLDLPDEGVTVLAVRRSDGQFLGAPGADVLLASGDTLVVYGHERVLQEVATRRAGASGQAQHDRSAQRHRQQLLRPAEADHGDRRRPTPEE